MYLLLLYLYSGAEVEGFKLLIISALCITIIMSIPKTLHILEYTLKIILNQYALVNVITHCADSPACQPCDVHSRIIVPRIVSPSAKLCHYYLLSACL